MKTYKLLWILFAMLIVSLPGLAQEPVVGVTGAEADALFTSTNPQLNANKQAAYHIMKDLLEANHWDLASQWITDRYIQHNPNVASGLAGVVKYFTSTRKPTPIPEHLTTTVVTAVVAEGDYVIVVRPRAYPDPRDPSNKYTTTWFDMWRFVGAKADEHWDGALINPPAPQKAN